LYTCSPWLSLRVRWQPLRETLDVSGLEKDCMALWNAHLLRRR
jgi:hypothetical protein